MEWPDSGKFRERYSKQKSDISFTSTYRSDREGVLGPMVPEPSLLQRTSMEEVMFLTPSRISGQLELYPVTPVN